MPSRSTRAALLAVAAALFLPTTASADVNDPPLDPPVDPALTAPSSNAAPSDRKTYRLPRSGLVFVPGITATCGTGPCDIVGTLKARFRGRQITIGTMNARMPGGSTTRMIVRPSTSGLRTLIKARKLRATATISLTSRAGAGTTKATRQFTLLAPRKVERRGGPRGR